jgi:predicted membrane protein
MNLSILGGLSKRPFAPGWTKESILAILGGGDIDLTASPPGSDARLTAVAVLGGVKILVPPGTKVSVEGFGFLGGREIKVSQTGDGPEIKMNLWAFLGGIEVNETPPAPPTVTP